MCIPQLIVTCGTLYSHTGNVLSTVDAKTPDATGFAFFLMNRALLAGGLDGTGNRLFFATATHGKCLSNPGSQ